MLDTTIRHYSSTKSKDEVAYHRVCLGETEQEIALKDGISVDEAKRSIQEGEKREFNRLLSQFLGLQLEAVIDKEELRRLIRKRFAHKFIKALGILLSGEKTLVCRDRKTGKIRLHKFVDPKVLAVGVEQYRKTVNLEEKPAPVAITFAHVHQNQTQTKMKRSWSR